MEGDQVGQAGPAPPKADWLGLMPWLSHTCHDMTLDDLLGTRDRLTGL